MAETDKQPGAGGRRERGTAVSIGTYDGVHLGHRRLIGEARHAAQERGLALVVVTFDVHPLTVVRPQAAPLLLTTLDHKLELLRGTGVDDVVVLHFDLARSQESAEDFVSSVLIEELHAELVAVGMNFRFGHGRRGDLEMLDKMGADLGFSTLGLKLVTDGQQQSVVSSTRIRTLIRERAMEQAATLLGRPHEVRGIVAELSGRDQGLVGVVVPPGLCMPPSGSYVANVGPVGDPGQTTTVRVLEDAAGAPFGNEILLGSRKELFVGVDGSAVPSGGRFFVQFVSAVDDEPYSPDRSVQ